ncbi:MAG: hypothetical protein A2Y78_12365 [Acidobacteria bacterium RBG_13_68_16]|jgi:hypothetical protein|nr:MAG: hypothetical protein A2Y78_12365 [Acidobacteria bacterium RBG_13_68_16]
MRAYLIFTGSGPILILTTFPVVTDDRLVAKLRHKGIAKFIAYEVPLDRTSRLYGVPFEVIAADLAGQEDLRVLDFNGHHIFANFHLSELGEPIRHGD